MLSCAAGCYNQAPDASALGTWTLRNVAGDTLPWKFGADGSAVVAGAIELRSDSTFTDWIVWTRAQDSGVQRDSIVGIYVLVEDSVLFWSAERGLRYGGELGARTLLVRWTGLPWRYAK
jgi:hypothetical protein